MRYVGSHIGRKVAHSFGDPIEKPEGWSRFWQLMMSFGLEDLGEIQNGIRHFLTACAPARTCSKNGGRNFTAAHSLRDNEHEMFVESVTALIRVADSYAMPKQILRDDGLFLFLFGRSPLRTLERGQRRLQMNTSSLVSSPPVALLAGMPFRLGGPVDKENVDYPRSHPLFVYWFGLLEEGFNLALHDAKFRGHRGAGANVFID